MRARNITKHVLLGGIAGVLALPTMAAAQDANDAASGGDIIVTAQRIEQRLQDVPISITVYSQDAIDKRNIVTGTDLATYTPSLSVNQKYGAEKASFAIRGFVQDQATAPSVGVYYAEVPMPLSYGATTTGGTAPTGALMDLQNVQVLKGPQGTLFGRNTTGGAVLLVPKKPTDRFEGYVEASAGDYNMKRGQAVLNVPLADTFKVRLSVDRQKRDGYMKNHSGIGPDAYNDVNYFYARLGIVADLTPDLENYIQSYYSHSFGVGYGGKIVACASNLKDARSGLLFPQLSDPRGPQTRAACNQIQRAKDRGDGTWDTDVNNPDPFVDLKQWSVINTTTLKASDTLTIKNIASYTQFTEASNYQLYSDNFTLDDGPIYKGPGLSGVPASAVGSRLRVTNLDTVPGQDTATARDFTEELQFQGQSSDGALKWQAGGYLERSSPLGWNMTNSASSLICDDASTLNCVNPLYQNNFPLSGGTVSSSRTKHFYHSTGIYAQATFNFSEKFSVTGGIRYTWDSIKMISESTRVRFAGNTPFRVCNDAPSFSKSMSQGFDPIYPDDTPNPAANANVGERVPLGDYSRCHKEFHLKSSAPTWVLEADFKPTPDSMIYAKWSRGYRSGNLNPTNVGLEGWEPEHIDAYEIGAKSTFRGAISGYFNIAGFYNDFRNQQIFASGIAKPTSGIQGIGAIVNAGKSRIYGAEVDASASFLEGLRFDLGYTYLNTKITKINTPILPPPDGPLASIIPSAFEGDPLTLSPKHRVTLTGNYTLPLDESVGKVSFGATYVYTDKMLLNRGTTPAEFQFAPSTNLVNLNLDWTDVMKLPVDVSMFVTNVTNEVVVVGLGQAFGSSGFEIQNYAAPRMFGARVRYKFGS